MHDMWLKACGIDNRMVRRAYRNKPLTQAEKAQNRLNASVRSTIERVFGVLKLHLGMSKTKYLGLARNHAYLCMVAMAYNLKRAAKVNALCVG
jgi:IS5 family transposase